MNPELAGRFCELYAAIEAVHDERPSRERALALNKLDECRQWVCELVGVTARPA